MWIKAHDTLLRHRKVRQVAVALGLRPVHVRGHLLTLWLTVLGEAPDGDLTGWGPDDIAAAAEYEGDPGELVNALLSAGLLDADGEPGHYAIHAWMEHAGSIINARRQAKFRAGQNGE